MDAAYAGPAAMIPEFRWMLDGVELADSLVLNPHKWMFVPMDLSVLFLKDESIVRRAFSLVPEYLTTPEAGVVNYMDYGLQLGRRFRALKLWFVLRHFGAQGIRERLRQSHRARRKSLPRGLAQSRGGKSWRRIRSQSFAFATRRPASTRRNATRSTRRSCAPSMQRARSSSHIRKSTGAPALPSACGRRTCARSAATSSTPGTSGRSSRI